MQLNEAVPAKFDFVQEEFSLPTVFRFAIDVGMMVLTGTTNGDHMRADLNVFDFGREPEEVESIKRLAAGRYGHAETDLTDPFANRRTESRVNWVESSRPPRTLPMATKTVWRIALAITLRSQVMKPPRSRLKKLYGWAVTIPPRFRLAECGKKKKRSRTKAGPGKAANLYLPRKWGFDHVSQNHDGRSSCDGVCADSFCYRQFFVSGFCQGRTRWARRTRVCSESARFWRAFPSLLSLRLGIPELRLLWIRSPGLRTGCSGLHDLRAELRRRQLRVRPVLGVWALSEPLSQLRAIPWNGRASWRRTPSVSRP